MFPEIKSPFFCKKTLVQIIDHMVSIRIDEFKKNSRVRKYVHGDSKKIPGFSITFNC